MDVQPGQTHKRKAAWGLLICHLASELSVGCSNPPLRKTAGAGVTAESCARRNSEPPGLEPGFLLISPTNFIVTYEEMNVLPSGKTYSFRLLSLRSVMFTTSFGAPVGVGSIVGLPLPTDGVNGDAVNHSSMCNQLCRRHAAATGTLGIYKCVSRSRVCVRPWRQPDQSRWQRDFRPEPLAAYWLPKIIGRTQVGRSSRVRRRKGWMGLLCQSQQIASEDAWTDDGVRVSNDTEAFPV